jgi:hypothetical protein
MMTIAAGAAVVPQATPYNFTLTGKSPGAPDVVLPLALRVYAAGTFAITVVPDSAAVSPGSSTLPSKITVNTSGGFSSEPTLTVTGIPPASGISYSWSEQDISAGVEEIDFQFDTLATTPPGTYDLILVVEWASLTRTHAFTLIVVADDFSISAIPTTLHVAPGYAATTAVGTLATGSFSSALTLSATGLPTGVSAGFVPATIGAPGTGSSVLTLTADLTAVPSATPATVTVTAAGGGKTHSVDLAVTIHPAFSVLSISPATGPTDGGTAVTVTGFGFVAGSSVTFGATPAKSQVVMNATSIVATTPASAAAGAVDVVVTNPGPVNATLAGGFTYVTPPGLGFYTVTPCRVVDTRDISAPAVAAGDRRGFLVAGGCAIPANAKAVALNATVVVPAAAGFLTLFPGDAVSAPTSSSLNFRAGQIKANNAFVLLGADGKLGVLNGSLGATNVVIDVVGYFQ